MRWFLLTGCLVVTLLAGCEDAGAPVAGVGAQPAGTGPDAEPALAPAPATPLVRVPALTYRPPFAAKGEERALAVAPFLLEEHAVTNAQFLAFVHAQPAWRRSKVARVFAEEGYLRHWRGDLALADGDGERPVVNVSWFAARAYARWRGRRLPTLAEWEAVGANPTAGAAAGDDTARILQWYARPGNAPLPNAGAYPANTLGIRDLHGVIWEWIEDFGSVVLDGSDRSRFCGSGAMGAADPSDYAAFMRQAFRSGLRGAYVIGTLGFRCAADSGE